MTQRSVRAFAPSSGIGNLRSEATINKFQTDLVCAARMGAVDEIGAAMAHQLNEPLTALLLYLHGIKEQNIDRSETETTPGSTRQLLENAIRETERFSGIVQGISGTIEMKAASEIAIARSREAVASFGQHLLTPRERQVLALITQGVSNKEGSHRLQISTRTFEVHRAHIMGKLGAKNAADLVRKALREVL